MVDIKPQFFPNTASAPSEGRVMPDVSSRSVGPTMNTKTPAKAPSAADSVDTRISVKARILNAVRAFQSSVGALTGTNFKIISTAPRMVSIEMGNPALATAFSANITIRQLAAPQIIVFRLSPGAKSDTVLQPNASPLKLNPVQPGQPQQTLRVGPGNDTIETLIQSLNGISGLKASLLQTKAGLALLVKTRPGSSHALKPASIAALRHLLQSALPTGSPRLFVATSVIAARDTIGELNGRPFVHASRAMDTLVPGYRISVNAPGQAHLQLVETVASLQKRVAALLRELNTLITFLATMAQRGTGTTTSTSLADRMVAHVLLERLRKIVSRPMHGFGSGPVMLSDLGIGLDDMGMLTLNEDRFTHVAQHKYDMVAAIIGSATGQIDAPPRQKRDGLDPLARVINKLIYDPTKKPVMATLNGTPLFTGLDASGRPVLTLRTLAQELSIVLSADEPITTDITYGQSLLDLVTDFTSTVLDHNDRFMQADPASFATPQGAEPQMATADIKIVAVLTQQITQGEVAQTNAVAMLPPQTAEILFYLLWIGLFIPDTKRRRRKKRSIQTPHGWRRKRRDPS